MHINVLKMMKVILNDSDNSTWFICIRTIEGGTGSN